MERKRKEDETRVKEETKKEVEKIREEAIRETSEKARLEKLEYEKKISDMQKSLEDAQRKGKQGSQQLQGDVVEIELEEQLRTTFPNDKISSVQMGISQTEALTSS